MYFCTFTLYQISASTFDLPLAILVPLKSEKCFLRTCNNLFSICFYFILVLKIIASFARRTIREHLHPMVLLRTVDLFYLKLT